MPGIYAIYAGLSLLVLGRELLHLPSNINSGRDNSGKLLRVCLKAFIFGIVGIISYQVYYVGEQIVHETLGVSDIHLKEIRKMPVTAAALFGVLLFVTLLLTSRGYESRQASVPRHAVVTMIVACLFLAFALFAKMLMPSF